MTTATTTDAVLAVERLEVRYGEARAVFGVDLEVGAGKVLAVLGPNGAGKTSLAAAITGTGAARRRDGAHRGSGRDRAPPRRRSAGSASRTCPRSGRSSRTCR